MHSVAGHSFRHASLQSAQTRSPMAPAALPGVNQQANRAFAGVSFAIDAMHGRAGSGTLGNGVHSPRRGLLSSALSLVS